MYAKGGDAGGSAGGPGGDGTANTGNGGNGMWYIAGGSGAGGSGVVLVRYLGNAKLTGGTITSSGGYTIHTFTSSGTLAS